MLRLSFFTILSIAILLIAVAAPALAQQNPRPSKPSGKMSYAACLEQKQKAGLPAARAAQVCQAITQGR